MRNVWTQKTQINAFYNWAPEVAQSLIRFGHSFSLWCQIFALQYGVCGMEYNSETIANCLWGSSNGKCTQCLATQKATSNITETALYRLLAQTSSIQAEKGANSCKVINWLERLEYQITVLFSAFLNVLLEECRLFSCKPNTIQDKLRSVSD